VKRATVAVILPSKLNFDEFAFKYFLLSLNKQQELYEFVFPETHQYLFTKEHYESNELFDYFRTQIRPLLNLETNPDYFLNVIKPSIGSNLFFDCQGNISFITTDTWDKLFSPPSLFEYLFQCIVASLLFMHPEIDLGSHRETRGCYFDYTYFKNDRKVDIVLGYVCQGCQSKIIKGAGQEFFNQIKQLINRRWIGEVTTNDSVAYNLKKFFKFDIDKDSGFNKTAWEKIREHLYEVPKEVLSPLLVALASTIVTLSVVFLGCLIAKGK
jgi:hypothetical protein